MATSPVREGKLGTSDHDAIRFHILSRSLKSENPSEQSILDFTKANWTELECELAAKNWAEDFEGMNVNEMWSHFHSGLLEAVEKYIPSIKRRSK